MTASECARRLNMTVEGVCWRIRKGKIAARKVPSTQGATGYVWEIDPAQFENGNGKAVAPIVAKAAAPTGLAERVTALEQRCVQLEQFIFGNGGAN